MAGLIAELLTEGLAGFALLPVPEAELLPPELVPLEVCDGAVLGVYRC